MKLYYLLLIINCLFLALITNAQVEKFEHEFLALQSQDPNGIQILFPGKYHGDELNDGIENLTWFALKKKTTTNEYCYTEVNYYLEETDIEIEKFKDIVDKGDEKTGKNIIIDGDILEMQKIVFFITGIEQHTNQLNIETSKTNIIDLYVGKSTGASINGDGVSLNAYGIVEENDKFYLNKKTSNYYVTATKYDKVKKETYRQVLGGTYGFHNEGSDYYHLIWAGDIDLDGKIDLLMQMSRHYNTSNVTLFLSSKAKEGEILGMVTQLYTVGC